MDKAIRRPIPVAGWLVCLGTALVAMIQLTRAQELTWEYSVQVSAVIQTQPPSILFSWPQDMATLPDFYTVCRKDAGAQDWGTPTVLSGTTTNYLDTNVTIGVAYEYQFYKSTSNHVGYGYICAGIRLPMIENRGKIILLVDQTFAADLADELARLTQDLIGDGWVVVRHDVPRDASVPVVKALVKADYDADPSNVKAVLLLGRIPVPYSGDSAPDGHTVDGHLGAWPADVFYGDMDGVWTDTTVTDVSALYSRNWNVPGDGKYDQSEIPGAVELEIGRVDFANMPGIDTNGIPAFPSEGELLRRYLNKDHNYRHKLFSLPARGLVFDGVGGRGGEAFADDAWRSYAPLFGPPSARPLNANEFLPILRTNAYQWAYATSGAGRSLMWDLGGTYGRSGTSVDFVQMDIQTAFVMLLGSWIGDWDEPDNLMRAVLATPTYGLACVYAGRPHWYFHYMGIGETLGYCARLTQNNHAEGLYRNQSNNFAGFVHIALLGDPALRLHTVAPPSDLHGFSGQEGIQLSWSPSADDVAGYYVYRATDPAGPFARLTPSLVLATSFLDSSNLAGTCTYMVRAVKLQTSPSGSYFNPSQGAFATLKAQLVVRLSFSRTNLTLAWPTTPGRVYCILWNNSLTNTNWSPLSDDMLAIDSTIIWSSTLSGAVSGSGWISTNVTHPPYSTVAWVDDILPPGAVPGPNGEHWNWVSNNPAPYSGAVASQSDIVTGLYQHYFSSATATMTVSTDDVLFAYVYLDPVNLPSEIMLQWNDGNSWEHRAFWGTDLITYGVHDTPARLSMGALPLAGHWFALQVPASQVGLAGRTVSGLAFSQYDGRATWDYAGKYSTSITGTPPTTVPSQRFYKILMQP
jgi:hypothetical protein